MADATSGDTWLTVTPGGLAAPDAVRVALDAPTGLLDPPTGPLDRPLDEVVRPAWAYKAVARRVEASFRAGWAASGTDPNRLLACSSSSSVQLGREMSLPSLSLMGSVRWKLDRSKRLTWEGGRPGSPSAPWVG